MQTQSHAAGEFIGAASKTAPPIAVTGAAIAGISLQDWVLISTLAYTALQIAFLVWKFFRERANDCE